MEGQARALLSDWVSRKMRRHPNGVKCDISQEVLKCTSGAKLVMPVRGWAQCHGSCEDTYKVLYLFL